METRLVGLEQVPSITEVASHGNELLSKEAPGDPGYIVVKDIITSKKRWAHNKSRELGRSKAFTAQFL
ncbi:hypothetical protein [Ktedonobacter robiniae]|uniref:Uncharacterized protein n=1 Tax=Ktedonobacter robiniae TaxID=2778365 RepID=A0ABQ3V703_9CHLR|nr:hypothetical protein [Ktedonobacter robiniae]GHO60190.1 hypothetical protein KSB_86650 [Ktedonobacter robiniae]